MSRTARLELQLHYIQKKKMHCQVSNFFLREAKRMLGSVVASTLKRKKLEPKLRPQFPNIYSDSIEPSREKLYMPYLCQSKPDLLAGSEIK